MTTQVVPIEDLTRLAVQEAFQGMLSMEANPEAPVASLSDPDGQIIGSVGFIGDITGIIYLYAGAGFARVITSQMLGIDLVEVDTNEMVNDAMGELSNIVVGHVKSRLCDAGLPCTLTIPSVVRGQNLSVEGASQVSRKMMGFASGQHHLVVEILVKDSQPK